MQGNAICGHRRALSAVLVTTTALFSLATHPTLAAPTMEEMWEIIQKQQSQIEALTKQLESADAKVEATAAAVEDVAMFRGSMQSGGWWDRTSIGGYGELHYNSGKPDRLDFHRFVLFVGHQFTDRLRLHTELEVEHALVEDTDDGSGPGEVGLEQAWIEYDFTQQILGRAGLYLLPVGIINETHEPPSFYGVERNRVESNIIPSTWWEGGAGVTYRLANGLQVDGHVHGGLDVPVTGGNAFVFAKDDRRWLNRPCGNQLSPAASSIRAFPGSNLPLRFNIKLILLRAILVIPKQAPRFGRPMRSWSVRLRRISDWGCARSMRVGISMVRARQLLAAITNTVGM